MKKRRIALVIHNVRSAHNVGSLLRTADGLGVDCVYLTGITPYPISAEDIRLPHLAKKVDFKIHKTALGAERSVKWSHETDFPNLIKRLRGTGYIISALEQAPNSISLSDFQIQNDICLIVGGEVDGLDAKILASVDSILEIPMLGEKESYNVANAAAIALFHLRWAA